MGNATSARSEKSRIIAAIHAGAIEKPTRRLLSTATDEVKCHIQKQLPAPGRSGLGYYSKVQQPTKSSTSWYWGFTTGIGMGWIWYSWKQETMRLTIGIVAQMGTASGLSKYGEVESCKATFPWRWLGHCMIRWKRNSNSRNGSWSWDGKSQEISYNNLWRRSVEPLI